MIVALPGLVSYPFYIDLIVSVPEFTHLFFYSWKLIYNGSDK